MTQLSNELIKNTVEMLLDASGHKCEHTGTGETYIIIGMRVDDDTHTHLIMQHTRKPNDTPVPFLSRSISQIVNRLLDTVSPETAIGIVQARYIQEEVGIQYDYAQNKVAYRSNREKDENVGVG